MDPIPAVVGYQDFGKPLVGEEALAIAHTNPMNTVYHMRRLLGRGIDDPEVKAAIKLQCFHLIETEDGSVPGSTSLATHEDGNIAHRELIETYALLFSHLKSLV